MARVIHIDRSFTPKHRSADADRVKPPEPGADPLEPKIQLAEMELVVPAGNAPAVSRKSKGKARQTRQAARKSRQKSPPTKQPAAGNGQSRVFVQKLSGGGLVPTKAPITGSPGNGRSGATSGGSSPRVFVRKLTSGGGASGAQVTQPTGKPAKQSTRKTPKAKRKSRVIVPMAKAVVWTVKKLAEQNRKRVAKKRAKQGKQAQAVQQAAAAAPKPVIKIIRSGPGPAKTTPTKPVAQSKPESIKKPVHQKPTPARKQSKPQPQPAPKAAPPRSSAAVAPPKQQPFAPPSRPAVKTLPQTVTNAAPASHPKQLPKVAPPPRPVARVAPSPPPRPVLAQAAPPPPRPKQAVPPPRPALQEPAKAKPKKFEKPVPGWVADDQKVEFASRRSLPVDALRGLFLLLLVSGGFGISEAAKHPELAGTWVATTASLVRPTEWIGLSPWDLLMAGFVFLVGVALPFSFSRREELGQSWNEMFAHACTRSALLVMAGIFLQSVGQEQTDWQFANILCQIGLGYIFAFMLVGRGLMMQLGYLALVLGGYTAIFIHYDAMGFGMSPAQLGVSEDDLLPGAFAPFTRDVNFAAGFDRWFLNLFPRGETWEMHPEGVQTLNFVPSIATMVIGVLAGELLRTREEPELKFNALLMAGVPCLMFGVLLGISFCPIISRLWTASWVFVSAAFVLWTLSAVYWLVEVSGRRLWVWPVAVLGANSLLVYLGSELLRPSIIASLELHFGPGVFGGPYGPVWQSLSVLGVIWLVCAGLYARRFFVRI